MKIINSPLPGLKIIEAEVRRDARGSLTKIYHRQTFSASGLNDNFQESYYSISQRDVIRGMHFQVPPEDHAKLIYVTAGRILDVILDIRRESPTYGQSFSVELSPLNGQAVYLPSGLAHGFAALEDGSCVTYLQTTMYSPQHEGGIRIDSFGFDWPVGQPVLSPRDEVFPKLADFKSPFVYSEQSKA